MQLQSIRPGKTYHMVCIHMVNSCSANGSIRTIIEKMENLYEVYFQLLISDTIASGKFAETTSNKGAAVHVCAWFASGFIDPFISHE